MSKRDDYVKRTEEYVKPILDELGFELYDCEFVKEAGTNYLRIFVDKEGGISVDECEVVSRRMNTVLDEKDYIDESYIFEVSSPGINRTLKKDIHFEKSLGSEVEVKLFKAVDGQKEYTGYLDDYDKDTVTIGFEDSTEIVLDRSNIAKINIAVHF